MFENKCSPKIIFLTIPNLFCLFLPLHIGGPSSRRHNFYQLFRHDGFGVKLATKVQNVFTVAKLVVIAIIIAGGFYMIGKGEYFILYIFTLIDTFVIKWKRNYYF